MRGVECTYPQALGEFLQENENGTFLVLRGKFQGDLALVPRGYIRNFILKKWDLTDTERRVFERFGTKDDTNVQKK